MLRVTADQMAKIDNYTINELKIPGIVLMENAALKVIKHLDTVYRKSFVVICGKGNNGGDGLAIARGLVAIGKRVDVYVIGESGGGTPDFVTNYIALTKMNVPIYHLVSIEDIEYLSKNIEKANTIVDCIFGTGLDRTVQGMAEYVIDIINRNRIYTLSVDVPSGLNATTGEIEGTVVDPNKIVTLQLMKEGLAKAGWLTAEIVIESIGIPQMAIDHVLTVEREGTGWSWGEV